ncbi:MAG: PQQ-dependent sugar dehydrogenase [Methylococcales bacterium]
MKRIRVEIYRNPVVVAIWITYFCGGLAYSGVESIRLPPGFEIEIFSDAVPDARSMALGEDGTVYVGTRIEGKVYALRDTGKNGKADRVVTLAKGLTMPNGVAVIDGALYVAEVSRLIRFKDIAKRLDHPPEPEVVYDSFPTDLHHGWKYLAQGPDGYLYMPVGAPCNICRLENEVYATIVRMKPDGDDFEIFARGVRNSVGFDWHPITREMYFTENGRDWMGDDKPPDELNHAPKPALHFGYPYCHGGMILDPEFGDDETCLEYTPPAWGFPAHVAALGIRFYTGGQFPEEYKNQLFVAQHGSWNRSVPDGYRIVLVRFQNSTPVSSSVFAEGWLKPSRRVSGRPVDILQLKDGSLLVSDDQRGAIYRISYHPQSAKTQPEPRSTGHH